MGITSLCDRLESGGWIKRQPSPTDRRVKEIVFEHKASLELEAALAIGDVVQAQALAGGANATAFAPPCVNPSQRSNKSRPLRRW